MDLLLVHDVVLPDYGKWSERAILDHFHPIHGPLPDLVQIWRCDGREFRAAVWVTDTALLATVELLLEETYYDEPMRSNEEVQAVKGWIMQSYRWRVDKGSVSCFDVRVPFPTATQEHEWARQLCEPVLRESVRFAIQCRS